MTDQEPTEAGDAATYIAEIERLSMAWRERAEKAEAERDAYAQVRDAYAQTSGDLCDCGWRGIRGSDPCAFCAMDEMELRARTAEADLATRTRERDEARAEDGQMGLLRG